MVSSVDTSNKRYFLCASFQCHLHANVLLRTHCNRAMETKQTQPDNLQ